MVNVNITIAIFFALIYNIMQNLSRGLQKYAIEGFTLKAIGIKEDDLDRIQIKRKSRLWMIGTIGTLLSNVFLFFTQVFAPQSSFPAAFGGVGIIALLIYCHYKLDETLKSPEIIGGIIILISTIFFGLSAEINEVNLVNYKNFFYIISIPLIIILIFGFISMKNENKYHAVIWGIAGGICAGAGISLFQTSAIAADREIIAMGSTFDFWIAFIAGTSAFLITQYGFKHGQASIVVTIYNLISLLIPILVDIYVLNQQVNIIQLIMLALIGLGTFLLTAFREY